MADVFGSSVPFASHCGIEEVGIVEGRTRLRMIVGPDHLNNLGIVHGGAIATLLDVAMGTAARLRLGVPAMTLSMQLAFLVPGRGNLLAEGRIVKGGRSILFTEAEVSDEGGALVATATGVFKAPRREG